MDRRISHSQYPLELRLLAEILDVSNHSFIYDDMLDFDVWTAPFSFRTVLGATWEMLRVPGSQGFAFLAKDLPGFRLSGSQVCFADTKYLTKGWLHAHVPQVQVLQEPSHFYEQLLSRSATARKVGSVSPSKATTIIFSPACCPVCTLPGSWSKGG